MDQKNSLKIVQLTWVDPHSIDEWTDVLELKKEEVVLITSVGILLKEDDHRMILTLNLDPTNESASCTMVIPKFVVASKKVIGHVETKKGS